MRRTWIALWAAAACVGSPAAQWATGSPLAYTLAPGVLALAMWAGRRLTRAEMGLSAPSPAGIALALFTPCAVAAVLAFAAGLMGQLHPAEVPLAAVAQMAGMSFAVTFVLALLTEDGFFRGALWGGCRRAGLSAFGALALTSAAFAAWHIAAAAMIPDFEVPPAWRAVYIGNMLLAGVIFGLLRMISGSLLAPALAHAAWNTLAYGLFGHGADPGLLGIADIGLLDPERGLAGLAVNALAVGALFHIARRRHMGGAA
ncbi:type II CAAX prenyl endopeptidase Rce1 family protein [Phenylobacterium sp.]|uniref:CPBP family glutamic-type intramembrane protease n=1 Tax=Phenylobacterium sp. TaxID=1871053 RepID=UPI00391D6377